MSEEFVIHDSMLVPKKQLKKEQSIISRATNWVLDKVAVQHESIPIDNKTREALETGNEFVIREYLNDSPSNDTPKLHIVNSGK